MAEITLHYDKGTESLTIWFGDPECGVNSNLTDSGVLVMEDENGRPLGIEVLDFEPEDDKPMTARLVIHDTSRRAVAAS